MDIIKRNFFRLLRSGALNEFEKMEPMSAFKWNTLVMIIKNQNIIPIALKGIRNHQYDDTLNIPQTLRSELSQYPTINNNENESISHLSNPILNNSLKKIRTNEYHAIDTSVETLEILNIIVNNVSQTLNNGIPLKGILNLGTFLRTKGDKVDFVKLEKWLNKLHIKNMAQLQGSILIKLFNFDQDELPFVLHVKKNAYALTIQALTHSKKSNAQEWHFKQSQSGFLKNNPTVIFRNLRRSIKYMSYSPIETFSSLIGGFVRSLSEIEE